MSAIVVFAVAVGSAGAATKTARPTGARSAKSPTTVTIDRPVRTDPVHDSFDYAVGAAQVVTAIGVPLLILQIAAASRQAKSERTRAFQEKYLGTDFGVQAPLTLSFLIAENAADCVRKIQAWETRSHAGEKCLPRSATEPRAAPRASVIDVQFVLGFFEDMATAYNRRELSRAVIRDTFIDPPIQVFVDGWWFVCWRRGGRLLGENGEAVYEQWQRMVESLQARNPTIYKPTRGIRVLCLPPASARRNFAEWGRARRLSQALSSSEDRMTEVIEQLRDAHPELAREEPSTEPASEESIDDDGDDDDWQVILVPSRMDRQPDAAWAARRDEAGRLAWWLGAAAESPSVDRALSDLETAS